MYLSEFIATGLRNLSDVRISLSPDLNIVEGVNAAGKSSLLEGVSLLVSGRSFRTSKNTQLISHDSDNISLFGEFDDATRVGVTFGHSRDSRQIRINGDNVRLLSNIASIFPVQVLSPESYHLIDSGPSRRRRYLDWLLFHVEHSYKSDWQAFNKVLKQRNSYLKSLRGNVSNLDVCQIAFWDAKYIELSEIVDRRRSILSTKIIEELAVVLVNLNLDFKSQVFTEYVSGYAKVGLSDRLKSGLRQDIIRGSTSFGPHKADLQIRIGNREVKDILSRGQKKMLINALYLSQTTLLKKLSNKDSLFLIDDIASELDATNQLQLVNALKRKKNVQVFISCLDSEVLKPLIKEYNNVNMFHVEHGVISKTIVSN